MKRSVLKFSMTVPLPLLLALLLTVSFSSCSKPNLTDIVKEHVAAVNNDDIEKNLTLFTDDGVFEPDATTKLSGKAQVRNLMEWDVVNHARLSIQDLKVKSNTVIAVLTEKNEGWRLLEIDIPFTATYEFEGRQIRRVKLEFSQESWKIFEDKFEPFAEWAKQAHPEEYRRMNEAGYSAEGARLFLSLAKEWRDRKSTEAASAEQELIKLENEWADAWAKRDVAFFERIETDDYTWTSPSGEVWTKPRDLAFVKSLKPDKDAPFSQVIAEMKVRVYGDAAVVMGRDVIKEMHEGKEISRQERWTDMWIKRAGRWQCVAGQSSEITQK
jgi:ketosteroid isomerase-like protein